MGGYYRIHTDKAYGIYLKIIFHPCILAHFTKFHPILLNAIAQIWLKHNYLVNSLGAATIQERPLLAWVRYTLKYDQT